jgi:hypothetical protein
MIALIRFVLAVLASPFKSKIRLEAENATLRHQLVVLRRQLKGQAGLANNDRWFFVQLYRWFRLSRSFLAGASNGGRPSNPIWRVSGKPVLIFQAADAFELVGVGGHDRGTTRTSVGSDQQIVAADRRSARFQLRADCTVVPAGNLIRLASEAESRDVLAYERSLQPGLVGAGSIVPVAGLVEG